MSNRLTARVKAYNNAVKKNPNNQAELSLLKFKIAIAQQDYDTTPAGLEQLKTQIEEEPNNTELLNRFTKASMIREQQTLALEEVKNLRASTIASLYSQIFHEYDEQEIFSVLETLREEKEQQQIRDALNHTLPEPETLNQLQVSYQNMLNGLENRLPHAHSTIAKLRDMAPPLGVNLAVYENLPKNFAKSKTQLKHQINEIATIQNTSPAIAEKYYAAYRQQYLQNYSNKPIAQQPNPPAHWVKGEFSHSGYSQSPTSRYAPHDKASMYAIYRLRADENAIPNYMKQTKQYILINTDNEKYTFTTYTPQGKKVKQTDFPVTTLPSLLQYQLTGKTLLQTQPLPLYLVPQSTINQHDYISKHFDLPSYNTAGITAQILPTSTNPLELHLTARKKIKKVWNNKPARANAPVLSLDPFALKNI